MNKALIVKAEDAIISLLQLLRDLGGITQEDFVEITRGIMERVKRNRK